MTEWKPTHRHYKGGIYRLVGPIRDSENWDGPPEVAYENKDGELIHTSALRFNGVLPDGRKRFEPIVPVGVPTTFAALEAWLAPQIGRNVVAPQEARAYLEFPVQREAPRHPDVDQPPIYRTQFAVCMGIGDTEAQAVEDFLGQFPTTFPGTDRFMVRSLLTIEHRRDFDTDTQRVGIRFRAARVPEWVLSAKPAESSHGT